MSGGYEFTMENVLKYRKIKKEQQYASFKECQAHHTHLVAKLSACLKEIRELENQIGLIEVSGQIDIKELMIKKAFLNALRKSEKKLRNLCLEAEEKLDRERKRLMERSRDEKVIVKMRERDYQKYLFEKQKKEAKKIDDLVLCREHSKTERSETI